MSPTWLGWRARRLGSGFRTEPVAPARNEPFLAGAAGSATGLANHCSAPAGRQQLQADVLEAHLQRPAGVDLQREDAAPRPLGVVQVHARLAVEERADPAAGRHDL